MQKKVAHLEHQNRLLLGKTLIAERIKQWIDSPGGTQIIGDNIVNKLDLPEPKINFKKISTGYSNKGLFESIYILVVETKIPLIDLYIEAHADGIQNMDIQPSRTGAVPFGHTGKRPEKGFVFTTLQDVYGQYKIVVATTKKS